MMPSPFNALPVSELSPQNKFPSPPLSDLPRVGELDSDADIPSPSLSDLPPVGELASEVESPTLSLSDLPPVGELDFDADISSPSLSNLPIVGELNTPAGFPSPCSSESDVPAVGGSGFDLDVPSPSLSDLPIVGEVSSDDEGACDGRSYHSDNDVDEIGRPAHQDMFARLVATAPQDWDQYQHFLIRNGGRVDGVWNMLQSTNVDGESRRDHESVP